jgi:hypothetical protein
METPKLKVGDVVLVVSRLSRSGADPSEYPIVKETRTHWHIKTTSWGDDTDKFAKVDPHGDERGTRSLNPSSRWGSDGIVYLTRAIYEARRWDSTWRRKIVEAVERADVDALRSIAAIVLPEALR